jgi:hypothetical protein
MEGISNRNYLSTFDGDRLQPSNNECRLAGSREREEADMSEITIREARDADSSGIRRLAALDDRAVPRGAALIAFVDGRLAAARSVSRGETVADPFIRTADAIALLDLRARQGLVS